MADPGKRGSLLDSARSEVPMVGGLLKIIESSDGKPSPVARRVNANARRDLVMLLAIWRIQRKAGKLHTVTA